MAIEKLETKAEHEAEKASKLPAFDGINLIGIKRKTEEILSLIGRGGIFDQYTRHDIGHINEMLKALDWIVRSETGHRMSPAYWLLIEFAITLHDLGQLWTN